MLITQLQQLHDWWWFLSISKCMPLGLIDWVVNFHTERSRCECKCRRWSNTTPCCSWPWWWAHGGLPSSCRRWPQRYGWCKLSNLSFLCSYGCPCMGCLSTYYYIQLPDACKSTAVSHCILLVWGVMQGSKVNEDMGLLICGAGRCKAHTCSSSKGISVCSGAAVATFNTRPICSWLDCRWTFGTCRPFGCSRRGI